MENLFNPAQLAEVSHLFQYQPKLTLAPWDKEAGTVPYNLRTETTSTVSGYRAANYWQYNAVSVSEDIF